MSDLIYWKVGGADYPGYLMEDGTYWSGGVQAGSLDELVMRYWEPLMVYGVPWTRGPMLNGCRASRVAREPFPDSHLPDHWFLEYRHGPYRLWYGHYIAWEFGYSPEGYLPQGGLLLYS
jgi:hypothetical protein